MKIILFKITTFLIINYKKIELNYYTLE